MNQLARIVAIDHAVPPDVQTADELAPMIGKSAEWICSQAGVARRYVSQPGDDPARLVAGIAKQLIDVHGQPDLMIHGGGIERQYLPGMGIYIGKLVGLSGVSCFSVNSTCLSFLTSLNLASSLLQTGQHQRVLVCTSECASRGRNFDFPESAALLGDGAAAAIVELSPDDTGLLHFAMETWPEASELAVVRGGGIMLPPDHPDSDPDDHLFQMDGAALLRFVAPRLIRFVRKFLNRAGINMGEIDWVVPHQTSAAGMKLLSRVGFAPEKIIDILNDYGNCAAASIPMALSIAVHDNRIKSGEHVLILGTAAGVSIGAALLRW